MADLFHHDGKAHGVYLGVLAGGQRLHDDMLGAVDDDLCRLKLTDALVVEDAALRPQHPQGSGAEGLAGVAELCQLCQHGAQALVELDGDDLPGALRELMVATKCGGTDATSGLAANPAVGSMVDKVVAEARETGYVTTMFGRRRELPAIKSRNFNQRMLAERMAMNTPIQGTAADVIKLAMIAAYHRLKEAGVKSRILLQVHDELVLEVVESELDVVQAILRESMEHVVALSVPLIIDIHWGRNWAEAK